MSSIPKIVSQKYQPPWSIWRLIEAHVHQAHEQQEIKRILGESLVDQSLELHEEVRTLMSISQEFQEHQSTASDTTVLPEPPELRERLVQEICFFVENVCNKAKHQGEDPKKFFARHNCKVIDYALETKCQDSPKSSSNHPLSALPSEFPSPPERECSRLQEEIRSMSKNISFLHVDDVLQNLRHNLEAEITDLQNGISFLQQCLDVEFSVLQSTNEPSLKELKQERAALERELFRPHNSLQVSPTRQKGGFYPNSSLRMHSYTATANPRNRNQPEPVKAIHVTGKGHVKEVHDITPTTLTPQTRKLDMDHHSSSSLQDMTVLDKPELLKRTVSTSQVTVVSVGKILSPHKETSSKGHSVFLPVPPSSTKPVTNRPSSADRLRKLILECREGT